MMMKILLLWLTSLASLAFAEIQPDILLPGDKDGNVLGNGGKMVVCRDDSGRIESMELFDIFLHSKGGNKKEFLADIPQEGDILQKASKIVERLRRLDAKRERYYQEKVESFFSSVTFAKNLPTTFDLLYIGSNAYCENHHLIIQSSNCICEQAAVQGYHERGVSDWQYIIHQDIWEQMSDNQRTMLLLHEIIYREFLEKKPQPLDLTQYSHVTHFVALLTSDQISWITPHVYNLYMLP